MHSFNMHFTQAQTHNNNWVQLWAGFIDALHIKTPICASMPIPKDREAIFTNYPSTTKDQALEETVFTLFHPPVVHGCFQLDGVTIEDANYIKDAIALHNVIKG